MVIKKNILVVLGLCALCVSMCGCGSGKTVFIGGAEEGGRGMETKDGGEEASPAADVFCQDGRETLIYVYVCGAVAEPGVVAVPEGSRAADALAAAGGFGGDACQTAVNLADWVSDGQMLYFPTLEEAAVAAPPDGGAGLVDINTADAALLCTLPGIGESRAADIISYREKNGKFACCEDIMKVPGIKTSVYEKIRDRITVR